LPPAPSLAVTWPNGRAGCRGGAGCAEGGRPDGGRRSV